MANPEHVELLRRSVAEWNKWREEELEIKVGDLSGADLRGAQLSGAHFSRTNLREADLRGASLIGAQFHGTIFEMLDPSRTDPRAFDRSNGMMPGHVYSLEGEDVARYFNFFLSEAHFLRTYFSEDHSSVEGFKFRMMHSICADIDHTAGFNSHGARLYRADLSGADLSWADFTYANLNEANLREANLWGTTLNGTDLTGADLTHASFRETVLVQLDLSSTKGLMEIQHKGPSFFDLGTIKLPEDGSSLHFLRGVGAPDELIDVYYATKVRPIQYHSVFISHSSEDNNFAKRLYADLQARGIRCWFAPEDMKIGYKIRTRINEAIHLQDKFLLLLSEDAISSSWVEDEVEAALEKEQRQQREVLFPVRLDESVMQTSQAWAAKLRRTRHIGDFTRWKNYDDYQQAFTRLLRDLKAGA